MASQRLHTFCTCQQLRQASRAITNLYDQVLAPSGLRATQFSLLGSLKDLPSISQLGQRLLLEQSTVTRNIKLLQAQGYVELLPGSDDNRKKVVRLTPLGKKKVKQALPLWRAAQAQAADLLGEGPRQQLMNQLQGLLNQLGTSEQEAGV